MCRLGLLQARSARDFIETTKNSPFTTTKKSLRTAYGSQGIINHEKKQISLVSGSTVGCCGVGENKQNKDRDRRGGLPCVIPPPRYLSNKRHRVVSPGRGRSESTEAPPDTTGVETKKI